jgi:hypothetical protein
LTALLLETPLLAAFESGVRVEGEEEAERGIEQADDQKMGAAARMCFYG